MKELLIFSAIFECLLNAIHFHDWHCLTPASERVHGGSQVSLHPCQHAVFVFCLKQQPPNMWGGILTDGIECRDAIIFSALIGYLSLCAPFLILFSLNLILVLVLLEVVVFTRAKVIAWSSPAPQSSRSFSARLCLQGSSLCELWRKRASRHLLPTRDQTHFSLHWQ